MTKISKDIEDLNNTISYLDLIDICRTMDATECTLSSSVPDTFTKVDRMLSHKTSASKFKMAKIVQRMLSDHNEITNQ